MLTRVVFMTVIWNGQSALAEMAVTRKHDQVYIRSVFFFLFERFLLGLVEHFSVIVASCRQLVHTFKVPTIGTSYIPSTLDISKKFLVVRKCSGSVI